MNIFDELQEKQKQTYDGQLKQLESGITCFLKYSKSWVKKTEDKLPILEKDLEKLLKNDIQADEKLWNSFKYLKISAREVCEKLEEIKWYEKWWIAVRTMSKILNRLWYNRKKIQKNKPLKKIPELDEIFENVHKINEKSDKNPRSVRISIDAKAKKNIWNLSTWWKSRYKNTLISDDHDTEIIEKLVPYWIKNNIRIQLAYYLPYHSKYNPIEHVFWTLEQYWNWIILNSVEKTIEVVKNMICGWKKPVSVKIIDKIYEKWVTIKKRI